MQHAVYVAMEEKAPDAEHAVHSGKAMDSGKGEGEMKTQAAAKTGSSMRTDGKVDEQILRVGFATLGISSLAIGIWALISLLGGMTASGGPIALIADWIKAILG